MSILSGLLATLLSLRPGDPNTKPSPMTHRSASAGRRHALWCVRFNGFMTFLPLYAREIGVDDAGIAFLVASATMVLIRTTLGRVPDIIGPIRAGSGALVVTVGAMVLVALWATPTGLIVGSALVAAVLSLQWPSS